MPTYSPILSTVGPHGSPQCRIVAAMPAAIEGRQFHDRIRPRAPCRAIRAQGMHGLQYAPSPVHEDDVDGPPHAQCMNGPAGPKPQPLVRPHAAKQEKAGGAPPEGRREPQAQRWIRTVPATEVVMYGAFAAAAGGAGRCFASETARGARNRLRQFCRATPDKKTSHGYMAPISLTAIGKPMIRKVQGNMQQTRGNSIFTGASSASFSARRKRSLRRCSDCARSKGPRLMPN